MLAHLVYIFSYWLPSTDYFWRFFFNIKQSSVLTLFVPCPVTSHPQWGTGGGGLGGWFKPPPPEIPKALQNRAKLKPIVKKMLKIVEFRTPTPKSVRKKSNKFLKLPPVRNCFTLAMTNKLFVIINSLKVPKIKKMLLYEMKFLVPNYSCLQNHWLGGYRPPDPLSLCPLFSTEFVEPPPPEKNSWVRHFSSPHTN